MFYGQVNIFTKELLNYYYHLRLNMPDVTEGSLILLHFLQILPYKIVYYPCFKSCVSTELL